MASERREAALTEPPQKRVRRDDSAPGGSMSGATPTAAISHSTPLRDVEMSSATEESIKFMASKLQNLPEARLPTDYPRTAYRKDQQMVDAEKSLSLHEDTCMSLLRFSLMANVKPFTIVLAAFACLIRKFTHEEDVVVGSSSSSSNPLALRVDLGDTVEGRENPRTLWELVQHVQAVEAEAEQHEVPFNELVAELRKNRADTESLVSLFQVRFFNACDVKRSTLEAAWCDWNVYLEQEPDAKRLLPLRLRVVYNAVLYDPERMEEMLRQLEMVAKHISTFPESTFAKMSTRTPESIAALPDPQIALDKSWNGAVFEYLHRHAKENPDKVFIVEKGRNWTYGEVDASSNRIAHYLKDNGVEREDVVALYAHRSSAMVVAVMGIMKSGATLTVIDPLYPAQRQNIYLSVARPKAIITIKLAGELSGEVEEYISKELQLKCRVDGITTAADNGVLADVPNTPVGVTIEPDNIGTLSFTSGSTGIPKGVRGRHVSLTHFYPWMGQEFNINENARFTMLSGIAHDPIQRDIFTPIFFGAQLHVPEAEDIGSPGRLSEWMREQKCTITHLTPAMGQLLTANALAEMPHLEHAFFVGDVLTKRDVLRLQALAKNITIVNMYGTTETQRAVSFLKVRPNNMGEVKDILPAGVGMKDVQLLVLSHSGLPCGVGELGEIYVRSPHLARGYLGLPEPTAEKFLQSPFNPSDPDDRMYRTGDLGRYNPAGVVECIGRADDQVKIRGFRIELREIDTFLGQHKDVRECVTKVRRNVNEEKILVSYFVPKASKYDISNMREFLKTKLPSYSIPTVFFKLKKMPLTPNGKIDSRRLPAPELAPPDSEGGQEAKVSSDRLTPMELKLQLIWKEQLGRTVPVTESFFDAGGHSVMATQVTFHMRKAIGIDVPLNLLYAHPTIREAAAIITDALKEPAGEQIMHDAVLSASTAGEVGNGSVDQEGGFDLCSDIYLDEAVAPNGREYVPRPANLITSVFLTGASGFVGSFLLAAILAHRPAAVVHCLVRGKDEAVASERLADTLRKNHLLDEAVFKTRVRVHVGDLEKPHLGLEEAAWDALGQEVDEIYHNGAIVHWVWPYQKMRKANVDSVREVFSLAAHPASQRLRPVLFVSSTSVFDSQYYVTLSNPVKEDDVLVGGEGLQVGYAQSKYVAEGICNVAIRRGLPCTIFRPAYILGSSQTGVTNVDDYIIRMIKGCIQMGHAPNILNRITCCPVDFLSETIVQVANDPSSNHKTFHFCNPDVFRFTTMFQVLKKLGYSLEIETYVAWRDRLMEYTLNNNDNALFPLLHFVLDDLPNKSRNPELDSANMDAALKSMEKTFPRSVDMVKYYIAFLVRAGYLPPPPSEGSIPLPLDQVAVSEHGLTSRSTTASNA